jgi:hypothetical protein
MKTVIRKGVGLLVVVVGFISSVVGIYSWVNSFLHLGAIYIPNPIVVVIAVVVAILLVVAAFVLGGFYMISMLIIGIIRSFDSSYKVPWYLAPFFSPPKPKGTSSPFADLMKSAMETGLSEREQKRQQQQEPPQELPNS